MKQSGKRALALALAALLILGAAPAALGAERTRGSISGKEEVVYATLSPGGALENAYVVNILTVSKAGEVTDRGGYDAVRNLTNTEELRHEGNGVTAVAEEGLFYYQGNLKDAKLPWKLAITYELDGEKIAPENLAGRSGALEISITTRRAAGAEAAFYENYMLQITVTLDADRFRNLKVDGGTVASSGGDKLVTFTVMPETDGDLSLTADVSVFEMATGISISAVPFSMDLDLGDVGEMTGGLTELLDGIAALAEGATALGDGAGMFADGLGALSGGSGQFKAGLDKLAGSASEIATGSGAINRALKTLSGALGKDGDLDIDPGELAKLPGALLQMADGLDLIPENLGALSEGFDQALAALEGAVDAIEAESVSEAEIYMLFAAAGEDPALQGALQKLVDAYIAAQTVKGTYAAVSPALAAVSEGLPALSASIQTVSGGLRQMAKQTEAAMDLLEDLEQLDALFAGIHTLAKNYQTFHDGLLQYLDGVKAAASGYGALHRGITQSAAGTKELKDGVSAFSAGARQMGEETKNMPAEIESAIDELTGSYDKSDFVPLSFVTGERTGVKAVQFVFQTGPITIPEVLVEREDAAKQEGFFDRLLALFR